MLYEIRPNLFISDMEIDETELVEHGVTTVLVVANDVLCPADSEKVKFLKIGLRSDRVNSPAIKDLACHIPKYLTQNGEKVAVLSKTGLERGAYVVCRVICELEAKTIYEVMQELKEKIPAYDITKSYF